MREKQLNLYLISLLSIVLNRCLSFGIVCGEKHWTCAVINNRFVCSCFRFHLFFETLNSLFRKTVEQIH